MEALLTELAGRYAPLLALLLVLALVDVLTGVGSALRRGAFRWALVAEFYQSLLLPKVIGWAGVTVLAESVSRFALPSAISGALGGLAGPGVSLAFLLPAVLELVASIAANLKEIGSPRLPPDAAALERQR